MNFVLHFLFIRIYKNENVQSVYQLIQKVVDSRLTQDSSSIRRRRECLSCGFRFTTYEYILKTPIMVVKKLVRERSLIEKN